MRKSFPSFGGVMLWDASQAVVNSNYHKAIKNALVAAGGTGFEFPTCDAPSWTSGSNYPGNSKVSFGGYVWQSKWFTSAQPAANPNGDWSAISACQGSGTGGGGGGGGGGGSGGCSGVAAWSSSQVYTGGQSATYNGHLWTAKWWTQGETPGGSGGSWDDKGAC
ncbi:Chitinase 2 [Marasmius tenuissimus]|nr:Chitinase 2 [Marasmius tenuissimus]